MGAYRYLTADTKTGLPLAELQLNVDSFSQAINEGGDLTATLPLANADRNWRADTEPYKSSLYVLRDDNLVVWGGPIVANPLKSGSGGTQAEIRAQSFERFLSEARRIKTNLTYTSADVFDIVRSVVDTIQGHLGGDLAIIVSDAVAGWNQTISWKVEDRARVWDEIQRLLQTGNGGEAWITVARDSTTGVFTKYLNLAAPQANTDLAAIVCEKPGNVIDYTWPAVGVANAVSGLGKGDGVSKLMYHAIDSAGQIAAGYPLVDADLSLGEEDDLPRLTARTQADLTARLTDSVIPQVVINGDAEGLEFGSFPLGVPCRLRVTDLYWPAGDLGEPGLDITKRVVGWSVKPPTDGGVEEVTLTLANGTGKIRPPMDDKYFRRYLRNLERRIGSFETRR